MENTRPEEEKIIKDIKNFFRLKKRTKLHCHYRCERSFKTRKRN